MRVAMEFSPTHRLVRVLRRNAFFTRLRAQHLRPLFFVCLSARPRAKSRGQSCMFANKALLMLTVVLVVFQGLQVRAGAGMTTAITTTVETHPANRQLITLE